MIKDRIIAPGIYVDVIDDTEYIRASNIITSKLFGLVVVAQKGPIGKITTLNNLREYEGVFGNPIGYTGLVATKILRETGNLKVIRVESKTNPAVARTVDIPGTSNGSAITNILTLTHSDRGTLFDDELTVKVENAANTVTLTIYKGTEIYVDATTYSTQRTADDFIGKITKLGDFIITNNIDETDPFTITAGTYTFSTGSNGVLVASDTDVVPKALDLFSDVNGVTVDIIGCCFDYPLEGYTNYVNKINEIANIRKDVLGFIDIPFATTPQDAVKIINGTHTTYSLNIDNSCMAVWYPWGKMYNEYTSSYDWFPASAGMLVGMNVEYITSQQWTAPAGQPRLNLSNVFSELERDLSLQEQEDLYSARINYLYDYKQLGYTSMGNKTLLKDDNFILSRINARFCVNYVRRIIEDVSSGFIFVDITEETMNSWEEAVAARLEIMKTSGGLYDYQVIMDFNTTTEEYLLQNIMRGVVQIKPTRSAEYIKIDCIVKNKDADF